METAKQAWLKKQRSLRDKASGNKSKEVQALNKQLQAALQVLDVERYHVAACEEAAMTADKGHGRHGPTTVTHAFPVCTSYAILEPAGKEDTSCTLADHKVMREMMSRKLRACREHCHLINWNGMLGNAHGSRSDHCELRRGRRGSWARRYEYEDPLKAAERDERDRRRAEVRRYPIDDTELHAELRGKASDGAFPGCPAVPREVQLSCVARPSCHLPMI